MLAWGAQREVLGKALEQARNQQSIALLLRAPAGVGRSRFLASVRGDAPDWHQVHLTGVASERDLPGAGLSALLRRLNHRATPAPDLLEQLLGGEAGAIQAFDGFLTRLEHAGAQRPLLVTVDDAHLLDERSARCLAYAARRLGPPGVAMVVAVPTGQSSAFDDAGLQVVELDPFDAAIARTLLEQRYHHPVPLEVATALAEHAGGRPADVLELAGAISEAERRGWAPLRRPLPATRTAMSAHRDRLLQLPPDARTAVLLLALADDDHPAPFERALRLAGIEPDVLTDLRSAGVVTNGTGGVRSCSPAMRSVAAALARDDQRQAAHRLLAEAYSGNPDPEAAIRRARHSAAGSDGPDPEIGRELARLARDVRERGDHQLAIELLSGAADHVQGSADRAELLLDAGELALRVASTTRARELGDAALRSTRPGALRDRAERLRAWTSLLAGRPLAVCVPARAGAALPAEERADAVHLAVAAAVAAVATGPLAEARDLVALAGSLADPGSEAHPIVRALELTIALLSGETPPDDATWEETSDAVLSLPRTEVSVLVGTLLLLAGSHTGRAVEAKRRLHVLSDELTTVGWRGLVGEVLAVLAASELRSGLWDGAQHHAEEAVAIADACQQPVVAAHARTVLAALAAARGDVVGCRQEAEAVRQAVALTGAEILTCQLEAALGLMHLGGGDAEVALAHLWAAHDAERRHGLGCPGVAGASGDLIEALMRAGDATRAGVVLERLTAREPRDPWHEALVERAIATTSSGQHAASHLRAAIAGFLHVGDPFQAARARLQLTELLLHDGARAAAATQARLALEGFGPLHARPWSERAHTLLTASHRDMPSAASQLYTSLTPQERRIATLVAAGRTNREVAEVLFITVKTVEYHLHKIYARLGTSSRATLARFVTQATTELDEGPELPGAPA